MKYYVLRNLRHDGEDYLRGSGIDLAENSLSTNSLLEAGVISETAPQDAGFEKPAPAAEDSKHPEVGGQELQSGEPSLDGKPEDAGRGEAEDVTPEVSEKMTRGELEEAARAKGISDEHIDAAENKAALVDLMTAPQQSTGEEHDPSANL